MIASHTSFPLRLLLSRPVRALARDVGAPSRAVLLTSYAREQLSTDGAHPYSCGVVGHNQVHQDQQERILPLRWLSHPDLHREVPRAVRFSSPHGSEGPAGPCFYGHVSHLVRSSRFLKLLPFPESREQFLQFGLQFLDWSDTRTSLPATADDEDDSIRASWFQGLARGAPPVRYSREPWGLL